MYTQFSDQLKFLVENQEMKSNSVETDKNNFQCIVLKASNEMDQNLQNDKRI